MHADDWSVVDFDDGANTGALVYHLEINPVELTNCAFDLGPSLWRWFFIQLIPGISRTCFDFSSYRAEQPLSMLENAWFIELRRLQHQELSFRWIQFNRVEEGIPAELVSFAENHDVCSEVSPGQVPIGNAKV